GAMMLTDHLAILPILLPLLAGTVLVLIEERHHTTKLVINIGATLILLAVAAALLAQTDGGQGVVTSYRLGDWPVPFAIVLVADRLSALMVVLTAVLALGSIVFS